MLKRIAPALIVCLSTFGLSQDQDPAALIRAGHIKQAKPLLETAHRLASEMPPDDRRQRLLEAIQERQKLVEMLNTGPFGFLGNFFEQMGDFGEDDDEWDEESW